MMREETFTALFNELQNPLYTYLIRMAGSREVAEELMQETFYRAMVSLKSSDLQYARAWLYKVARHLYVDWLRKHTIEKRLLENMEQVSDGISRLGNPEEAWQRKDTQDKIAWVMKRLPERMRTLIYLREIEDFSYQELAETMEMNMNQIKVNRGMEMEHRKALNGSRKGRQQVPSLYSPLLLARGLVREGLCLISSLFAN
jgi:RNA polymerase sigma factor (sigma-70 family)